MPRLRPALLALSLLCPALLPGPFGPTAFAAGNAAAIAVRAQATPGPIETSPQDLLAPWRPTLFTDDTDQEDRLRFKWSSHGVYDEDDTLEIWDSDPAEGEDPVLSERLDSDALEVMDSTDGVRDVRVRTFLGFREFWWTVGTDTDSGDIAWSEPRSVSVVPSPMQKKRVRVNTKFTEGYSTKRPGTTRLRITSSPRARVRVEITHRGSVFWKKKYTEGVGRLRGFDFKQSCGKQGQFNFVVQMRDPYGAKVTKRGHWTTSPSRCAALRAKEQRKADEERRRRERQREKEREKDSSGTGESSCHPSYSPQCLKEGIGDYDCEGGGGDGPNYVSGPVYVSGADPFGLDKGGEEGVGCE